MLWDEYDMLFISKRIEGFIVMHVLTWIDDGGSANAAYASTNVEALEERVKDEWLITCSQEWPDENLDDELERTIDSGDGSIVFRFNDPVTGDNEIFAQIEKVEVI